MLQAVLVVILALPLFAIFLLGALAIYYFVPFSTPPELKTIKTLPIYVMIKALLTRAPFNMREQYCSPPSSSRNKTNGALTPTAPSLHSLH